MTFTKKGPMPMLRLLLLILLLSTGLRAEGNKSPYSVGNRTAYWTDTSVGVGLSAEVVDFTTLSGVSRLGVLMFCPVNRDGTNDLLYTLYAPGESFSSEGAAQLTTPANDTISRVIVVPPAAAAIPRPPCEEGTFGAVRIQSKTTAVSAFFTVVY